MSWRKQTLPLRQPLKAHFRRHRFLSTLVPCSNNRSMASNSVRDVCPVCLGRFVDARVLTCLHSACKGCVDRLAVAAKDGLIDCPLCRAQTRLSSDGASGLPKDVSVTNTSESCGGGLHECATCLSEGTNRHASAWCSTCHKSFCESHALPHMLSTSSGAEKHFIGPLPSHDKPSSHPPVDDVAVCSHHREPLKYFCGTCQVLICGECAAVGSHHGHKDVRRIKDVLEERKTHVTKKVDTLEKKVVAKLESSLQEVDDVSTQLGKRAKEVRTHIQEAGQRAKDMVDGHVQQMIQDVDDLEEYRCKVLDQQRDRIKSHLDAARNAVEFRDRVMQFCEAGQEAGFSLLHALETRTDSLLSMSVEDQPRQHSRLEFQAARDTDLACKAKDTIGKVIPCQASAKHSEIKGGTTHTLVKGKQATITIRAKDIYGEQLTRGGDFVTAQCARQASARSGGGALSLTITDNSDGTYALTCLPDTLAVAEYSVELYVNGEKMSAVLVIKCVAYRCAFDPQECHRSITISQDGRRASIINEAHEGGYKSVVGCTPMQHGQFSWKLKIGQETTYYMFGVAFKPLSPTRNGDYGKAAYCWEETAFYRDGVTVSSKAFLSCWKPNDVIQLDLDCDGHTLRITNYQSGETRTFSNLPDKEYFQYAALNRKGNCLEFVE